jgi:hypothetical protein
MFKNFHIFPAYDSKLSMAEQKQLCSLLSSPVPEVTRTSCGKHTEGDNQNLAGLTEKQNLSIPDQLGTLFNGAVIHNMTLNFNFR